jgi:MFS family permease
MADNAEATAPVQGRASILYPTIVCFLAMVFAIFDYSLFGALLPVISQEFGWSPATGAYVATLISIGTFFVAIGLGPVLDQLGRKPGLILTTGGAAVSSGFTALASGVASLSLIRVFSALGFAEQQVNATYLNEMYGSHPRRGLLFSFVQGGWPIGITLGAALSILFLPILGWRGTFLIATFPAVVIVMLVVKLQESPEFLRLKTERKAAKEAGGQKQRSSSQSSIKQLFSKDLRSQTLRLGGSILAIGSAVQVLSILATTVLVEAKGVSFGNSLLILVVSNLIAFVGYLVLGHIGDRIGRKRVIVASWLGSALAFLLMLLGPNADGFVLVLYTIGYFLLAGPFGSVMFYLGESFPTRLRGTGVSAVNSMVPIGLMVGSGILTVLLRADVSMTVAALVAGVLPLALAGLLMAGTQEARGGTAEAQPGGRADGARGRGQLDATQDY